MSTSTLKRNKNTKVIKVFQEVFEFLCEQYDFFIEKDVLSKKMRNKYKKLISKISSLGITEEKKFALATVEIDNRTENEEESYNSEEEKITTHENITDEFDLNPLAQRDLSAEHYKEEDYLTGDEQRPFQCKICPRKFRVFKKLVQHIPKHSPMKCPVCNQSFSVNTNIKTHMRIHTGLKPFECSTCHKKFTQSNTLRDHLRTHTGEKPYQCDACGLNFARKYSLNLHKRRKHTLEKPFVCTKCDWMFASASELSRHMRTHTGEKRHLCDICTSRFSNITDLRKHLAKHDNEKTLNSSASTMEGLDMPMPLTIPDTSENSGSKYQCSKCSLQFSSLDDFERHSAVHDEERILNHDQTLTAQNLNYDNKIL